jgi:monoamine oxidase
MRADMKNGGQYLRIATGESSRGVYFHLLTSFDTGTQTFSKCLASLLTTGSLVLNSPVWSIQQTQDSIFVSSGKGQYRCQRAIVSLPTPLYKDITFSPPLPKDKLELSSKTKLGYTTKMNLVYKEPWWRAANLAGMSQSWVGPVSVTRDVSVDEKGLYALTCFAVGAPGRAWSKLPEHKRKDVVVAQIKRMFGPFVPEVPEPIDAVYHIWAEDQWSQGCPCPAMPAGVLSSVGHALRSTHEKVHFVGTETAYEWKGYMDGAIRSGERGAMEVIQQFGRAKL